MTVRINKQPFNLREKLSELERPIGLKGSELMRSETVQEARDLVSAGRKNLVINGSMSIAQRGVGPVTVTNNTYQTVDRFKTWINYNSGTVQVSQDSDAPSGFTKSLKYTSSATTAQYHILSQIIEANNLSHIKAGTSDALPLTISFWVKSNKTGNFNFEIVDDDTSHHIVKQYTINTSGQWEYKSIFIPPNTSGGVMTIDNTIGYELFWFLGSSTSYSGTALTDNWASFLTTRRNTGGNVTLDSGDYWQITGVQLEVGRNATDFEHRSYGEELALCQRYYQNMNSTFSYSGSNYGETAYGGWQYSGSAGSIRIKLPVQMRTSPTLTVVGSLSNNAGADGTIGAYGDSAWMYPSSITASESTPLSFRINVNGLSGSGKDAFGLYFYGSYLTSNVKIDAEL